MKYHIFTYDWQFIPIGEHPTREDALKAAEKEVKDFAALFSDEDIEYVQEEFTELLTGGAAELRDQYYRAWDFVSEMKTIEKGDEYVLVRVPRDTYDEAIALDNGWINENYTGRKSNES